MLDGHMDCLSSWLMLNPVVLNQILSRAQVIGWLISQTRMLAQGRAEAGTLSFKTQTARTLWS